MKKLFLFILVIIILQLSCKENTITPPDNKPPGWQEDIPWPSLADSPWPTNHADMQRTGRSKYIGPQQGVIFAKVKAAQMQTGVVFGTDSIFYYGTSSRNVDTTQLVAAKIDGTILWSLDLEAFETSTTPLVDDEGTIYIANGFFRKIFAVNPDGTVKWTLQTSREVFNDGLGIGKDGTIYAIENGSTLDAINRDGTMKWQFQDNNFLWGSIVNLAFSPDGNTLYIHGGIIGDKEITLVAFDLVTLSIKWKFGHAFMRNGPLVDSQGNVYVLVADDTLNQNTANFYCLYPDGSLKWKFPHSRGYYVDTDPTIDKNGNIYFATETLYALDYSGKLRWKLDLVDGVNYCPLVCDSEGTVYIGTSTDFFNNSIFAVSKEGLIKWSLPIYDERSLGQSPAITKDGTLVYPTFRSDNLYIIK
ncbi:MAG: PQQ-like beta-propeller repeat protein [Ignavibacteriales bacterium]|nr:MAG: PQQ-like beta-propeller repeat protein [Ignavibacteriales bacterium]